MKIQLILITFFALVNVNLVSGEALYKCDGIIQNKPCATNANAEELKNLPSISRYSAKDAIPPGDTDTLRARPKGDVFDVPKTETEIRSDQQDLTKSAVRGNDSNELVSRSERLKAQFAKGQMSVSEAEAEVIRLRVLHDTLCTKQVATNDARMDDDCRKAAANIQTASAGIRDAKTNL
jgi:hypothetical protein